MLIDAFIFYNELDILEARLYELLNTVDVFVLVEATQTFAGNPKDLLYKRHKDRYAFAAHKTRHIIVDDMPEGGTAWDRERHQRNAIRQGLGGLNPTARVLISDVDEIPDSAVLRHIPPGTHLMQDMYYYNLTCKLREPWIKSFVTTVGDALSAHCLDHGRLNPISVWPQTCGWHLSYFGDVAFIINKIQEFSHQELNTNAIKDPGYIQACINSGICFLRGHAFDIIPAGKNGYIPQYYHTKT